MAVGEIPKFLISKNHEIEVLDSKYSGTPLAWACYCGNLELVKYLVELGANVNAKNSSGQIPMDLVDEEHMQYGEFYEKLTGNSKYTATKKKSDTEKKVEEVSPRKSDRRFKDSDESDGTVEGKWYNFHKIFEFLVDNFDEDNESEEISYPQETDHMVTRSSRREPKNLLNPDNISFISSVGMVSSKNIIRKVIDPSHFKHHSLQIHPSVRTLAIRVILKDFNLEKFPFLNLKVFWNQKLLEEKKKNINNSAKKNNNTISNSNILGKFGYTIDFQISQLFFGINKIEVQINGHSTGLRSTGTNAVLESVVIFLIKT
ncbi:hypothetical protein HK099_003111 [Clydaea vesicula]|uniref:Uncharacterized protein n=1 Tax=Clydaea vesicula TaxID=447962 RepID=A0AAD5Y125_9FUNG|nr:hypothetical protein HK099_003111 [Clydaea vesicula]